MENGKLLRLYAASRERGFTLIELLVVILIIGILIAVAAPSFLGQTQKAHDSASQQYLTVAYRAATAWAVDHNNDPAFAAYAQGDYATPAGVAATIHASEPELTASVGSCPALATTDPKHITVDTASGGNLVICNDPDHRVWTLTVSAHVLIGFSVTSSAVPPPGSPANSSPPTVADADNLLTHVQVGDHLTVADNGSWTNSPDSYTYTWQYSSNGTSWVTPNGGNLTVSDPTHPDRYTVAGSDLGNYLRVVVQATNVLGSTPAGSAATSQVIALLANTQLPSISGSLLVGSTLTAGNGLWSGSPTSFTYVWQRCDLFGANCADISGATTSTYVLQSADLDKTMRSRVTATNSFGSAPATSAATAQVNPNAGGSSLSAAVLGDGPVAFYQLDEGAGSTTAADSSGNSITLTASSTAPTFGVTSASGLNTAAQFSGTQRLAANNSALAITGALTVEAWVKTTAANPYNMLIGYTNGSAGYGLGTDSSGHILFYNSGIGFFASAGAVVNDGAWHQIAVTDTPSGGSNNIVFYRDGVQVSTATSAATFTSNGGQIYIGATGYNNNGFAGSADNIAIFNKALSSTQIGSHAGLAYPPTNVAAPTTTGTATVGSQLTGTRGSWSGSSPLTYAYQWQRCSSDYPNAVQASAPLAYYRFEETSGTTAADSSGHGLNATFSSQAGLGVTGAIGNAVSFGSSSAKATVTNAAFALTGPLTLEAWVKTTSGSGITNWVVNALGSDASGHTSGYGFGTDGSRIFIYTGAWPYGNYYETNAGTGVNDGQWHHIAVVLSSATSITFYKDGTSLGAPTTATPTNALPTANNPASGTLVTLAGSTFVGSVDELAIYGSALSGGSILAHYNAPASNCSNISSATSLGYTVQSADSGYKLRLEVTTTNPVTSVSTFTGYTTFVP